MRLAPALWLLLAASGCTAASVLGEDESYRIEEITGRGEASRMELPEPDGVALESAAPLHPTPIRSAPYTIRVRGERGVRPSRRR